MKNKLRIIAVLFIISSCASKSNNEYSNSLSKTDSLKILLPEFGNYSLSYLQIYENENDTLLFAGNVINNSIDVYDLVEEKFKTRIEFQKNGPSSISSLQGFFVINLDSILVFPNSLLSKSLLVNMDKSRVEDYPIQDILDTSPKLINHVSSSSNPVLMTDNSISFVQYPLFDVEDKNNVNNDFSFEIIFDTENKKMASGEIFYPSFYHDKIWSIYSTLLYRTNGDKQSIVYSWSLSDSIYVKTNDGQLKGHLAKGNSHKNISPFSKKPENSERIKWTIENINYKGILYDKYRNVYYRVVLNPAEFEPTKYIDYKAFFDQQISIITLDSNFKKIDETLLPQYEYTYSSMFVGPKGLYVSKAHPKNNLFEEDYLFYDIFLNKQF